MTAYVKTAWNAGAAPGISAANLNNLETQYDDVMSQLVGMFIGRTVILNGTVLFTTPANCTKILVQMLGAGGGGGACGASATYGGAGGGGAGGYAEKVFTVVGNTGYTVAVGAKGAGGVAGNNDGSAGGNTTFTVGGVTVTAKGGSGGIHGVGTSYPSITALGGAGALISTNGDVNGAGGPGDIGWCVSNACALSGKGASTHLGGGGGAKSITTGQIAGDPAVGFGAGGSGAASVYSAVAVAGGNGADGIIIVWAFTS